MVSLSCFDHCAVLNGAYVFHFGVSKISRGKRSLVNYQCRATNQVDNDVTDVAWYVASCSSGWLQFVMCSSSNPKAIIIINFRIFNKHEFEAATVSRSCELWSFASVGLTNCGRNVGIGRIW